MARIKYSPEDKQNLFDLVENTKEFIIGEGEELSDRRMVLLELRETCKSNDDIYPKGPLTEQMIQDALVEICGEEV